MICLLIILMILCEVSPLYVVTLMIRQQTQYGHISQLIMQPKQSTFAPCALWEAQDDYYSLPQVTWNKSSWCLNSIREWELVELSTHRSISEHAQYKWAQGAVNREIVQAVQFSEHWLQRCVCFLAIQGTFLVSQRESMHHEPIFSCSARRSCSASKT